MIERLFAFIELMINTVGTEDLAALAANARIALDEAAAETAAEAPRSGVWATISLLSKPESQRSLRFLLGFAEKLQQHSLEGAAAPAP